MSRRTVTTSCLLFLALTGCVSVSRYEQSQAATKNAMAARETMEGQLAACASARDACGAQVATLEKDSRKLATVQTELEGAQKAVAELSRQEQAARQRASFYEDISKRFAPLSDQGMVVVRIDRGRMSVMMNEAMLFDSGKAEVRPDGRRVLEQVASVLKDVEGRSFQVEGHMDSNPPRGLKYADNWELSAARAVAVLQVLTQSGVDMTRLSAAGYADVLPIAPNDNDANRALNRRIEIVFVPTREESPWRALDKSR